MYVIIDKYGNCVGEYGDNVVKAQLADKANMLKDKNKHAKDAIIWVSERKANYKEYTLGAIP